MKTTESYSDLVLFGRIAAEDEQAFRILFDRYNTPNLEARLKQAVLQIKNNYSGEVRDKAFTFLGLRLPRSKAAEDVLNEILQTIETGYCLDELTSYADKNFVGERLFNFHCPIPAAGFISSKILKGRSFL